MTVSEHDLATIERMMRKLRELVPHVTRLPFELAPISLAFRDAEGRGHRLVVLRPHALASPGELALVAFFGERRADANAELLHRADDALIEDLREHPGIVSYSSLELGAALGANLVLASDRGALERWQRSERHASVASELAPRHYTAVRIHLGSVSESLGGSGRFAITATREISFAA